MTHPLKVIALLVLIVPAVGLVIFGPRPMEDVPKGRVVVEYWEKWSGPEEQLMRKIINGFNDTVGREKNIYVRYLSTSEIDRKTLVAIAAGVPPDIAGMWDHTMLQYAAKNALEPLEDLAAEYGFTESLYKPVFWRACNCGGHLYGVISTPGVVALMYNRRAFEDHADLLRAKGLDPFRAPRSIAEMDAYSDALTVTGPGGSVERVGYLPMEPGWYLPYTAIWFGGQIWDEQQKKMTLLDPAVVNSYDWMASYSRKLGAEQVTAFRTASGSGANWDSPQNPFVAETLLMEQNGPWMANYFEHLCPEKQRLLWSKDVERTKPLAERKKNYFWAVAAFPSAVPGEENVSFCTSDVLVIPRGAKHKREAFVFMNYLNRQEIMESLCSGHCKTSPLAKVSESFIQNHPNPYIDVFEELSASPNAHNVPQIPIQQEFRDEMESLSQRVTLLQTDALSALKDAQARLDAKYGDYLQMQEKRNRR